MNDFPKLALGTWLMGGAKDPDPNNDDAKDIAVIKLALENGITLIDTAQNYAGGRCEELVGEALVNTPRNKYQLLTKQRKDRLSYQNVIDDCHSSLQRLKVDYLDYFACHAPNQDADMKEFFRASNDLHKQGKLRNVGVSNFGPKMLEIALATSDMPITFNQVHFSLDDDDVFSTGTYDFCLRNGIVVQAFRVLANLDNNQTAINILAEIAESRGLTVQQVAISYINSFKGTAFTIRASSAKHWDEIKQALEIKLESAEVEKLKNSHKNLEGEFRKYLIL